MAKRAPRLQFTEEERASPELAPAIQKADKRIKKLEKAEAKIPKKEVKQRVVDSDGKITTRLSFEEKKPPSKLSHAAKVSGDTVLHGVHRKVQQSNDGDNAGVDAANTLTEDAESVYQVGREIHHAHELQPYRKAHRAEKKADKANVKALNQEFEQQNGGFSSNPYSRWQQNARSSGSTLPQRPDAVQQIQSRRRRLQKRRQRKVQRPERKPVSLLPNTRKASLLSA